MVHGVRGNAGPYAIKSARKGAFISTKAWFTGVKVQPRVKVSRTNLQAIGRSQRVSSPSRGWKYQDKDLKGSRCWNPETCWQGQEVRLSCHGKARNPGKPGHTVTLLRLGPGTTGSIRVAGERPFRTAGRANTSLCFGSFLLHYDPTYIPTSLDQLFSFSAGFRHKEEFC